MTAGIFAQWQPRYAEAGVATFPIDGTAKKPAVGNYLKAGRRASEQWAAKFPNADALGFACGKRNRLTVLDVDEPNEKLLADAFAKLGPSPVIIQTASGKFHAWYRHGGEGRSIKKQARALGLPGPVDILGAGYAIAPPSRSEKGEYRWIQGSLADLDSLPTLRLPECLNPANHSATGSERMGEGERNDTLFRACLAAARTTSSFAELLRYAHDLNQSGQWAALASDEVERAAMSAWRYQDEGRNLVGRGRAVVLSDVETAILERDPDALYLFTMLRREHWGRDFVVANEWRNHLASGAWSLPRFRAARNFLLSSGLIYEVRPATRGVGPALYRFSSPLAVSGRTAERGV